MMNDNLLSVPLFADSRISIASTIPLEFSDGFEVSSKEISVRYNNNFLRGATEFKNLGSKVISSKTTEVFYFFFRTLEFIFKFFICH